VRTALVAALLLAMMALADEPPSPVTVAVRVEPQTVTIGTRFRYVVDVTSAQGTEVFVTQPSERIGDFDIVDFGIDPAVTKDGKTVLSRWYTLVGYHPGEHLVKAPPVHYRVAGSDMQEAPGAEIRVSVESVLEKAGNPTDVKDIKAPEEVPIDRRPYYIIGGGLLLAALVGFGLYRFLTRDQRTTPAAPPRPPQDIAREELERLRRRGLIAEGAFKEYYSSLSDIVRTYVEHRFHIRAPEMTTEEFLLVAARGGKLLGPHRALLSDFLVESDLVKFARHMPTIADSERAWTAARRFVDETAAAPEERQRAAG
jgi:hypothetical protein